MKLSLTNLTLCGAVGMSVLSALKAAESPTHSLVLTPDYLSQLADEAATNNPALKAAATRVRAAEADHGAVRTWDDPMVMLGGVAAGSAMRQEEGDIVYGVEQRLPLWGKPRAERDVAQAGIERAQAQADFDFQMLRLEIARQAFRVGVADERVRVGREDSSWLEIMTGVAEDRYRAGDGSQVEVLRMQNERSKRALQVVTEERQRHQEHAQLNRILARTLTNGWPRFELPPPGPPVEFNDRLQRMVLNYEAKLRVLKREVVEIGAIARRTEKRRYPDVSAGIEGRQYGGDGEFKEGLFVLKLNLPLWNRGKYRRDIERDQARLQAAEQELADYELFVPTEARRIVTLADAARRQALLYRDEIIPRSELALRGAHAAWTSNKGMFLDLMEARRMVLEARLEYALAVAEQYSMLIELTLCCGAADLEALQMLDVAVPGAAAEPK